MELTTYSSRDWRLKRAQAGYPVGRIPLGYLPEWDNRLGVLRAVVDPVRGPLITDLFKLAGQNYSSVRILMKEAERIGLKTWDGRSLSTSTTHHILTDYFYAGMISYQGHLYYGKHVALLDMLQMKRIRFLLAKHSCRFPGA